MALYVFLSILALYVIISLFILPMQYRYLVALKDMEAVNKNKGRKQSEMYDRMEVSEMVLHENVQGSPLFLLPNLLASIIYRIKHPKK